MCKGPPSLVTNNLHLFKSAANCPRFSLPPVFIGLHSTKHGHSVELKVKTENRENPAFDTVSDIWQAANFYEREVFDLFGIRFNNHPDLRRIVLDENWQGYPFRKDYVDEVNIVDL